MTLVVTGGSESIVRDLVLAAVQSNCSVAFSHHRKDELAESILREARALRSTTRCRAYALDPTKSRDVEAFMEAVIDDFGRLDSVVINPSNVTHKAAAADTPNDAWLTDIDTNVTSSFFVAREALGHFLHQRGGRLVFVSSIAWRGVSDAVSQAACSSAVLGLSASIAKEYGRRGISSATLVLDLAEATGSSRHAEFRARYSPLGRAATSQEVAEALLFLARSAPPAINGEVLTLGGGLQWLP